MANTRGLSAGIRVISRGLLRDAEQRRDFSRRVEQAMFNKKLTEGDIEPVFGTSDEPDFSFGGSGFRNVSVEERLRRANESLANAPVGKGGKMIPEIGPSGRAKGYRFLKDSASGGYPGMPQPQEEEGFADDPIAAKIEQLRAQGVPDDRIATDLRKKGIDPARYGING